MKYLGYMKSCSLLLIFATLLVSCNFTSPQISDKNQHFENDFFSIDYPQEWSLNQKERESYLAFVFYNPLFPSFNVTLFVTPQDGYPNESFENIGAQEAATKRLKNEGYNSITVRLDSTVFDGNSTKIVIVSGKKSSEEKLQINSIAKFHNNSTFVIMYDFYSDFDEKTKHRLESIVNSIHLK